MLKEVLVNQWINRMVEFALLRTVLWLPFPKMDLSPLRPFWATRVSIQVEPGKPGAEVSKKKHYKSKKEFAYRMCTR